MFTLALSLAIAALLAGAALSSNLLALLCALITGTAYYAIMLIRAYGELPRINILRIISLCTGLFYFGGASLVIFSRITEGENPYIQIYAAWRNYDVVPLVYATLLSFACVMLTLYVSYVVNFPHLNRIFEERHFSKDVSPILRERIVGSIMCLGVSGVCAFLLATGKLTVSGGGEDSVVHQQGQEWVVLASEAAPATVLLLVRALVSRGSGLLYRVAALVSVVPIGLTIFVLGRRYIIASLAITIIALIVYRGVRMRPWQWAASGASALVLFFAVSGPFILLRQAQTADRSVGISEMFDAAIEGRQLGGTSHTDLADLAALSAARSDLMGELAQIVSHTPAKNLHYGTGWLSQLALIVPHTLWPDKQAFISRRMYNDSRVCADAGLPPQDLAGTLVLYSFGEVGWAAPLWYCLALIVFLSIADRLVAIFSSYPHYLMTISTLLFYAFVADNSWTGEIIQELRFLVLAGVVILAMRLLAGTATMRAVLTREGPRLRTIRDA